MMDMELEDVLMLCYSQLTGAVNNLVMNSTPDYCLDDKFTYAMRLVDNTDPDPCSSPSVDTSANNLKNCCMCQKALGKDYLNNVQWTNLRLICTPCAKTVHFHQRTRS